MEKNKSYGDILTAVIIDELARVNREGLHETAEAKELFRIIELVQEKME